MNKKDEIINNLIKAAGTEVDYWLLESNKTLRENEYGSRLYSKMRSRMGTLRHKILENVLALPEAHVKLIKHENRNRPR
jgi:hypothetical protein